MADKKLDQLDDAVTLTGMTFYGVLGGADKEVSISLFDARYIGGALGSTDNRLLRADGTGARTAQGSAVTVDDSGNMSGVGTLESGAITATGLNVNATTVNITSASAFTPQVIVRNNANDANAGYFMVRKSRGVTDTAVQVNDALGTFIFQGYDSTGTPVSRNAAYLGAIVEAVSAGAVSARFDLVAGALIWSFHSNGVLDLPGAAKLKSYTVATMPAASLATGGIIYVSNETGGAVPAFSDGTNWRRVQDRNIVS